jgi:hypothetical protein
MESESEDEINTISIPILHAYFRHSLTLLDINTGIHPDEFVHYKKKLEGFLMDLKDAIKTYPMEFNRYIEPINQMIIHTRDCYHGKGERAISYVLLDVFYKFYPLLAIRLVHLFVKTYGSWRDIKELCHYLHTSCAYDTKEGFIRSCIDIVNAQLFTDLKKDDPAELSLVAKWIPRENKKHDWLFDRLAYDWSEKYEGFGTSGSIYKKRYRLMVAKLNRQLKTLEIHLCEKKCNQIEPVAVPKIAMMKQKQQMIFKNISKQTAQPISIDRLEGMMKFKNHFIHQYLSDEATRTLEEKTEPKKTIYIPVHLLVKEALVLLEKIKRTPSTCFLNMKNYLFQIEVLNKQWNQMANQLRTMEKSMNTIPLLEMSFELQTNPRMYYQAIGLAILIAQQSSFGKRILVMDNVCTWVNLSESPDFFSMVKELMEATESYRNTVADAVNTVKLLTKAINESNLSYYQTRGLTLVFLATDFPYEDIKKTLTDNLIQRDNKTPMPTLVFWNHYVKYWDALPAPYNKRDVYYLSGGYFPDLLRVNRFENNPLPTPA